MTENRSLKHGKILFTTEDIEKKVSELGLQITKDYKNKDLLLITILKGGIIFIADLMRSINLPVSIDFMAISSYGVVTESSGIVKIIKDLEHSIENKNILIIEDIIDTGLTLSYLIRNLESRNPLSIEVCTLLDRTVRRIIDIPIRYKGFDLADVFVVGYGLDYAQKYRNLPYIAEFEI